MRNDCEFEQRDLREWYCTAHEELVVGGTEEPVHCPTAMNEPISVFKCRDCGAEIEHWDPGVDEVCVTCGALHNAFGQRLNDDAPMVGLNGMSPSGWDE